MPKHTLVPLAAAIGLIFTGTASAVELTDIESAPHQYAKKVVVLDPETKEEAEQYHFGSSSIIWRAESMNDIFAAYGLKFDANYVDEVPKRYCHLVEVKNGDGEEEMVMKFNDKDSIIWKPNRINQILTAYGVSLDQEQIDELPGGYAWLTEVVNDDGETEEVVKFGKDNIVWPADKFNQILAAYN